MEAMKRLYIVSFGDSRKYRVEFEDVANVDPFHHTNPLASVEADISEYLEGFSPENLLLISIPRKLPKYTGKTVPNMSPILCLMLQR